MSDRIEVRGIRGFGHHGVLPHEQQFGQEFTVDVAIDADFDAAAATDDLAHTVDYGQVVTLVHARITGEPFELIETLADRIAADVAALPGVQSVTVSVHKPHAPMPVGVSDVIVTRHRRAPSRVVLGLGSNLGDRLAELQTAVDALVSAGVRVDAVSPVMRTAPVGGPAGQDDFFNVVAVGATELNPFELLRVCQRIEEAAERDRSVRWGPRPIDVDILDFGGRQLDEPDLVLPHPRAAGRAFVLLPWSLVGPEDRLGGVQGQRIADLAQAVDSAGVEVVDGIEIAI
jgi:dihydroneopterin aldolase/2-amino-4-hydroxy-6-hydroxymethyldihydropteridine diphosphokinase